MKRFSQVSLLAAFLFAITSMGQSIQGDRIQKSICISRSQYDLGKDQTGHPGIYVQIWVEQLGLVGEQLTLATMLRTNEGQPVQATQYALPETVDASGSLRWTWTGPVTNGQDPLHYWTFIPFNVISLPTSEMDLIIRSEILCGSLRTYYDAGIHASQNGVQFTRGVMLSGILQKVEETTFNQPNPAGFEVSNPNITVSEQNVVSTFYNNVMGFQGQTLYSGVTLKHPDGQPVRPSTRCPASNVGKNGGVQVQRSDPIVSNQAQCQGQPIKLPLKWTELNSNQPQTVIVTGYISANGFWNVREFETLIGPQQPSRFDSSYQGIPIKKQDESNSVTFQNSDQLEQFVGKGTPFALNTAKPFTNSGVRTTAPPLSSFQMVPGVRHDLNLPGKVYQTTISPQEPGNLSSPNATLSLPSGAVRMPTRLFMKQYSAVPPTQNSAPPQAVAVGPLIDLGPEGTTFRKPVTLSLSYNPEAIPQNMGPQNLVVAYFDGQNWKPIPGQVDPINSKINIQLTTLPGITLTTLVTVGGLAVINYVIWEPVLHNIYDWTTGDPSTNEIANQYVTPNDPIVIQKAQTLFATNSKRYGHFEIVYTPTQLQNLFQAYNKEGIIQVGFRIGNSIKMPNYQVVDNWGHDWIKPAEYFNNGMKGDCKNIANAYCSVFRALGFQAKCVDGDGVSERHVWCEIAINGTAYYVDEGNMMMLSKARNEHMIKNWTQMWDEKKQEPYREHWWLLNVAPGASFSGSFAPDVLKKLSVHPKDPSGYYQFTPPLVRLTIQPGGSGATFTTFNFKTESCVMVNDRPSDYSKRGVIRETRVQCLTCSSTSRPGDFTGQCKVWREYFEWDRIAINAIPEKRSKKDYDVPWFASKKIDANGKPYYILQIGHAVNRHSNGGTVKYDLILK